MRSSYTSYCTVHTYSIWAAHTLHTILYIYAYSIWAAHKLHTVLYIHTYTVCGLVCFHVFFPRPLTPSQGSITRGYNSHLLYCMYSTSDGALMNYPCFFCPSDKLEHRLCTHFPTDIFCLIQEGVVWIESRALGAPHIVTWIKQTWINRQCTLQI